MDVLNSIGLLIDAIGAVTLVIPELPYFDKITRPRKKIERIDQGRETLFTEEKLLPDDTGFDEIVEILDKHVEIHGQVIKLVASDPGRLGSGDWVEIRYETGGDAAYAQPSEKPSRTVVDRWCERAVRRLERKKEIPFFRAGVLILLLGFTLQFISTLLPL